MSTYRAVGENLFIYSIELDLLAIFGYDLFQYLLVFRGYSLCQDMYRNLLFRVIHTNRGY